MSSGIGRPRASSRETLAEAACELFLERGFAATSITDIASRAGVSRSSFFNYFAAKADVLWDALDDRIDTFERAVAAGPATAAALRSALDELGEGLEPDALALAIANAEQMAIGDELVRDAALRRARIATAISERLRAGGCSALQADVAGAAHAGAVLAAIEAWAHAGAGSSSLRALYREALDAALSTMPGPVRQLRVVARADAFEHALHFYRDVVGMPEQESYEGDGGARVAILGAGRATLELSNAAQIDLIDRVETDGDAPSDDIRLAFEVDDTAAMTATLTEAGAELQAAPRVTPWRSSNARLRTPASLQVTIFQELGDA